MAAIKPLSHSYHNEDELPVPGYVNSKQLAAGVAESFTVPAGAKHVHIHSTAAASTFVKFDGTATVPGDITDGTAPHPVGIEGHGYYIEGVATISVISSATPIVVAEFFK